MRSNDNQKRRKSPAKRKEQSAKAPKQEISAAEEYSMTIYQALSY